MKHFGNVKVCIDFFWNLEFATEVPLPTHFSQLHIFLFLQFSWVLFWERGGGGVITLTSGFPLCPINSATHFWNIKVTFSFCYSFFLITNFIMQDGIPGEEASFLKKDINW